MQKNRLTVVYTFNSLDDIDARHKATEILESMKLQSTPEEVQTETRLHEIFNNKQPRNIPIATMKDRNDDTPVAQ